MVVDSAVHREATAHEGHRSLAGGRIVGGKRRTAQGCPPMRGLKSPVVEGRCRKLQVQAELVFWREGVFLN
jgi:hypothetical protein